MKRVQSAPEFNPEEDVSYESDYQFLKVFTYTCIFVYAMYKGNQYMQRRLQRRQARLDGRLDEFLAAEDKERKRGFKYKLLGDLGHRPVDGIAKTSLGGDWELIDLDGRPFGSRDLKGHYYLLFFGSSLCPDVCPLTLMTIMKAHRQIERLSEGQQYCSFIPIFVGTNPRYDTRKALIQYRDSMFGEDLICLQNDPAHPQKLQSMLKHFKVPAGLTPEECQQTKELFRRESEKSIIAQIRRTLFGEEVTLLNDHSPVMYLLSCDNKFLTFYQLDISVQELVQQILDDISQDIGQQYIGTGKKPTYTD